MPTESWTKCPADKYKDGYNNTTLRSDVAEKYNALYQAVHELGGIVTSSGGKRWLDTQANPASQSKTSLHYLGRAFDMSISSGMNNPTGSDPYVIMPDAGNKWVVWGKSNLSASDLSSKCLALGIEGGSRMVMGAYMVSKKMKTMSYSGLLYNFTTLAKQHGFDRISARTSFIQSGNIMGAEWWHFQNVSGLVPQETTFGDELLRVYTEEEASQFVYWDEVCNARWQIEWKG
jgi:hypothetical protein